MKYSKRPINFVLFGYYGFSNFGDELLCSSLVTELFRLGYNAETLRILVGSDDSTAKLLGVAPLFRNNFFTNVKAFLKTKILLFGGGGIFQDEKNVLTCLYYLCYEIIAKFCGCKVYMIGQSIGPLNTRCGKALTNIAFRLASRVTVRDRQSKEYLECLNIQCSIHSDLVLLLNDFGNFTDDDASKRDFVLLNIRDRYTSFSELVVQRAKEFAVQHNLQLKYLALSLDDKTEFEKFIKDGHLPNLPITLIKNFEHFKSEAQTAKFALGMRLHFCILAFALCVPIALCPYNPKVRNFAEEYDLPLVEDNFHPLTFKQITYEGFSKLTFERNLLEKILLSV